MNHTAKKMTRAFIPIYRNKNAKRYDGETANQNKKHLKDTRIRTNRKLKKQRRKKAQTSDRSENRRPSKNNQKKT